MQRMLKIHNAVQSGQYPTVAQLAKLVEKGERTIQRDIDYMASFLELPLAYCPRYRGWHYTREVLFFPTQFVTEADLQLIAVLEESLSHFEGSGLKRKIEALLEQFTDALPNRSRQSKAKWRRIVSVRVPNKARYNPNYLDFLAQAAASEQEVRLRYRKPNHPDYETRILHPYHLFAMNGDWYVLAREHKSRTVKRFSLLRMKDLELTGNRFERPETFCADDEFKGSFGLQSADGSYEVILRAQPNIADFMRERDWNGLTRLEPQPDGHVHLHFNLSSLVELKRWIVQWEGSIRVMHPAHLRQMVAEAGRAIYCENREPEAAGIGI